MPLYAVQNTENRWNMVTVSGGKNPRALHLGPSGKPGSVEIVPDADVPFLKGVGFRSTPVSEPVAEPAIEPAPEPVAEQAEPVKTAAKPVKTSKKLDPSPVSPSVEPGSAVGPTPSSTSEAA